VHQGETQNAKRETRNAKRFLYRTLERYGIDGRQLFALFSVYFRQDVRGGKAFTQFRAKEYVTANRALLVIVGSYVFIGVVLGMAAFTRADVFVFSALMLTFTLFIVALAILAEAGNVLFNENEGDIVGHLPIAPRTLFAAKVLNLLSFTMLLGAAANLFPTIAGIWASTSNLLFVVAHAVSATLVSMFATGLVVVSYGLLMKYVNRERFDNIVAYGQVVLVLFFMLGSRVFPRVLGAESLAGSPGFQWYFVLCPPAWFSGVAMLIMGKIDSGSLLLAGLAIGSLILLGAIAVKKIAGGYSSFMSTLAYGPERRTSALQTGERISLEPVREGVLKRLIYSRLVRRPVERAVFDLVMIYLRRNREIKVRLYPSLAYFLFFPLLAVFTRELGDPFVGGDSRFYSLIGAAMIPFVGLTAVEGLIFSEHYQASHIFLVVPIGRLADVHRGFRKALLIAVAVPGYAVLCLLFTVLWWNPWHAVLLLLPWMMITPVAMMIPFLFRQMLPLSRKYQKGQQSARNITLMLMSFFGLSAFGTVQSLAISDYLPYWSFVAAVAALVPAVLFVLGRISGDARPLVPAELRIKN
jgi:hypothetical protein